MKITGSRPSSSTATCSCRCTPTPASRAWASRGPGAILEASAAAVETFKRYLIGQDPLRIEHHWQYLYRWTHFRGAAIMGALSAIDIALWDIAGKHFGVPVYQLLGGKSRDKARVYYHVFGEHQGRAGPGLHRRQGAGLHRGRPPDALPRRAARRALLQDARRQDERRHRRRCGATARRWATTWTSASRSTGGSRPPRRSCSARGIEPYHPFFYEDPILPDSFDAMALVAREHPHPHRHRRAAAHDLRVRDAAARAAPCSTCGRTSAWPAGSPTARRSRRWPRRTTCGVVPHNPLSPVSTAACLQLAACIPNFALQEYPKGEDEPPKSEIVKSAHCGSRTGFLIIPDAPGIGIELAEDAAERHPYRPREVHTRLHVDGSVVDQ